MLSIRNVDFLKNSSSSLVLNGGSVAEVKPLDLQTGGPEFKSSY